MVVEHNPIHTSKLLLAALAARAHWLTVEWLPKYASDWQSMRLNSMKSRSYGMTLRHTICPTGPRKRICTKRRHDGNWMFVTLS